MRFDHVIVRFNGQNVGPAGAVARAPQLGWCPWAITALGRAQFDSDWVSTCAQAVDQNLNWSSETICERVPILIVGHYRDLRCDVSWL